MSLDKPQPVDALSTSYEFGLPRAYRLSRSGELNVLPLVLRNDPSQRWSDGHIDACGVKRPQPYRAKIAAEMWRLGALPEPNRLSVPRTTLWPASPARRLQDGE
jgi:hypothetical protein